MQIHTNIDDQRINQAAHLTGVSDKRSLLEQALRLLIQSRIASPAQPAEINVNDAGFWERLQSYRGSVNLAELGDVDDIFGNVRDSDPGRAVEL